ncbi:caffeoylshikimate esterase-like [Juglans microcarpa x Juglans regia]|uniref:caffeoylshikimate esterase-like n=1 Tax=Juglans microcarpa x Juglans regia TaxID=2249226 RepID=UPI001B7EF157|nr:caffeoylshikimate esterase-like [Juglans microcarpa x Juglans regia]
MACPTHTPQPSTTAKHPITTQTKTNPPNPQRFCFVEAISQISLSFLIFKRQDSYKPHMALKPAKLSRRHPIQEFRARVWTQWRKKGRREVMAPLVVKFPGIDKELQKVLEANMDEAPARRRARDSFKDIQLGIDHILFKTPCDGLEIKESYEVNSRGLKIFSKCWLPLSSHLKAVVCYCHGYGDTCTFFFEGIARKLASSGYGVFAMDYPGFGLSEGLHGYIPSFDWIVDDVIENYSKVKENPEFRTLPSFLFGQSLGGAVALKVHLKQPNAWDGAILVAPMCKIADNMVPPWLLKQILIGVAYFLPKQKLVPQKDLAEAAFRDLKKRELTAYNVIAYNDNPRLRTAVEMLRTTQEIERRLQEVSLPLLILHGEADIVTDPSVSKALYEKASSSDKKLSLYKDAYHSLLEGEPDEIITQVFHDIISWLDEHTVKTTSHCNY